MIDEVRPETNIEWLWVLDLVELPWEILRFRRLKQKIIESFRQTAIEMILQRLDGSGIPFDASPTVVLHARRNALQWREDSQATVEIEARLERYGFDATAINAACRGRSIRGYANDRPDTCQSAPPGGRKRGAEAGCWPFARRAQHEDSRPRRC
jgi:hypothetical protein